MTDAPGAIFIEWRYELHGDEYVELNVFDESGALLASRADGKWDDDPVSAWREIGESLETYWGDRAYPGKPSPDNGSKEVKADIAQMTKDFGQSPAMEHFNPIDLQGYSNHANMGPTLNLGAGLFVSLEGGGYVDIFYHGRLVASGIHSGDVVKWEKVPTSYASRAR